MTWNDDHPRWEDEIAEGRTGHNRYGYIWNLQRWYHRRKIKADYPSFWQAVIKRRAW